MSAVSVVVASRNRPDQLAAALDALAAALRPGDEVVVVDSASEPPVAGDLVASAGARLVRCARPGASRARNAGLAAAAGQLVAFTDDDCRPEPGWLEALDRAFADHPRAAFVTGTVTADRPGDGPPPSLALSVVAGAARTLGGDQSPSGFGHGANMAWRRPALVAIGGFDEALGPGTPLEAAEDVDLFVRAVGAGYTGWFAPEAVVRHQQWRTPLGQLRVYAGYGVGAGALAVKAACGDRAAARRALWSDGVVRVGRAVRRRHPMGAAAEAARLAGLALGLRRARRLAVVDGRFATAGGPAVTAVAG